MWDYPRCPHGRPWGRGPPDLRSDSCLVPSPASRRPACYLHACVQACLLVWAFHSFMLLCSASYPSQALPRGCPHPWPWFPTIPFPAADPLPRPLLFCVELRQPSDGGLHFPHTSYANETSIRPSGVALAAQPRKGGDPKRDVSHMIGSSYFSILFHIRCETCGRLGGHMVLLAGELAHVPRAGALGIEA